MDLVNEGALVEDHRSLRGTNMCDLTIPTKTTLRWSENETYALEM